MRTIGAVDIGGTKIAVGAVREDGTILWRGECPTDPSRGFLDAMQRIRHMLRDALAAGGAFHGIGVACPGPLDPFTGVIGEVGTLPGWKDGNLVEEIRQGFEVPVVVENDADAAALAEYAWGTARGVGTFIFVTVSTGIGGGIVLNGQLYRGVAGSHPELGHQVIDNAGPLCYCGARGCWETLASGTAMSEWFFEKSPHAGRIGAAAICERAAHGDPLAVEAVKREGYYVGLGLANMVTLFCPDVISLGGGVMKSSDLWMQDARNVVRTLCTQVPADKTSIILASLGAEAGLLGATQAWLWRQR